MQKITRIYVGNYGIDMAWYDGITFDLTDPDDGNPTDTIINLENGGGKTTLLSFIFSCFETSQERFLKHIQNKNHRFSQYFAKDGLPGIVLIEWLMPARVAGGAPYRLVTGQAVAVRTNAERDEVDRVFFSFEASQGLTFETVPAPKLCFAPVTNMNEFSRWMHESHKTSPDFFHTRTQSDWQKHLRDERLIDVEMLQLQVNFSAQEGGIDTGFLTFTSEPEFIRKFFDLTLDPERSAAVRLAVVNTCDKLSRRPHFQQCLTELTKLRDNLTHFNEVAGSFATARASQDEAVRRGSGLALSLDTRNRDRTQLAADEATRATDQELLANESAQTASKHGDDVLVLTALRYLRSMKRAEAAKEQAAHALTSSRNKRTHVMAAQARRELDDLDTRLTELDAMSLAAKGQLAPWLDNVEKQGALLRRALYLGEQNLRKDAKAAAAQDEAAQQKRKQLNKEMTTSRSEEQRLVSEQAALNAGESAFTATYVQLVREGLLETDEETAMALFRHTRTATASRAREEALREQAEELGRQEKTSQAQSSAEGTEAVRLKAEIGPHERYISEGEAEREQLSQLPSLRQAADAETADPDSAALLPALDRLVQGSESEVAQCDVRLAALRSSKAAIIETGVAGATRDVNEVVARLREMGVRSATPFNTYIAQALPDAAKARILVTSNPARFLGVCVASAELDKARTVLDRPLQLAAPVMVSAAALEADPLEANRFVLPAADDAAFNCVAAIELLSSLDSRLEVEENRRSLYANRQREALSAKQRLNAYCSRFGDGATSRARAEVARLAAESQAALERAQEAGQATSGYRAKAESARAEANESSRTAASAEENGRAVRRFIETHETGRPIRLARIDALRVEIAAKSEVRERIEALVEDCSNAEKLAFQQKVRLENSAAQLASERGILKYYSKSFPAELHLENHPQELAGLREMYADTLKAYEAEAQNRMGLVHERQDAARNTRISKAKAFTENFPGVQLSDFSLYLNANFAVLLPTTQHEIDEADKVFRSAENKLAVAASEQSNYAKAHKTVTPVTQDMVALSDAELDKTILTSTQDQLQAAATALAAKAEADRCRERARQAREAATQALNTASALRAALSLPELLDAEPEELFEDIAGQTNQVIVNFQLKAKSVESARIKAYKSFEALKVAAGTSTLQKVEPDIASQLLRNDFDAACADSTRLLEGIEDRIGTTQSSLDGMTSDFENCVGELSNLTNGAITLLNSATTNKKVPVGAPYVGGKAILKMRARFHELGQDVRRQHLRNYLDSLIGNNTVPAKGPELVAEALLRIHGKPLGMQMLKMVPDENLQYVAVDKIQNSGGEGVVMAMFLYMVINQLRSETQAKLKKAGGGPLILDNPFAKATTPTLWKAQRMLAESMDVQLIFATALPDYNTVGEFGRFVRLRKAGKNTKTGRWHLEAVDFKLSPQAEALAA